MENMAPSVVPVNSAFEMLLMFLILGAVMYFAMIRPNKKKMEEYQKMLAGLRVGSKIVFAGGIYGVVKSISEDVVRVEIADGVIIEVPKSAVANIV